VGRRIELSLLQGVQDGHQDVTSASLNLRSRAEAASTGDDGRPLVAFNEVISGEHPLGVNLPRGSHSVYAAFVLSLLIGPPAHGS
jgi:hypothetical protein